MADHAEPLQPGTPAPDFALRRTPDETVSPRDSRGRRLIIAFYPADWSPVCTDQMALYNEVRPMFEDLNADLVGISIDHVWCHNAFAENRNVQFPLLADFHPKGDVARRYGVYDEELGMSERALFVLDEEGVIRWSYVSPIDVNPGVDGILQALEAMDPERQEVRA